MMPFEGLSDEKDDQLVNILLEAARSERSDDAMVARVLAAVGIGSAALFGSASLSAQSTLGSSGSTGSTGLADLAGDSLAGPASGTVSSGAASNGGAASSSGATTTTTVAAAAPKVGVLGKLVAAAGTSAVKWGAAGTAVVVLGVGMGRSLIGQPSVAEVQVAVSQAQRAASDAPPTEPLEQEVMRPGSLTGAAPAEPTLAPVPETSPATGLAAQGSRAARSAVEPGRHAVRRDSGPVDSALTREVMLVDRARAALAAGATGTTLTTVELYAREFPHGRLLPEAIYLQMEAQVARGDVKQAEQSARRLLAFGKSGIHRARAHKVLEWHLGR